MPSPDMVRIIDQLQAMLPDLTVASCATIYDTLPSYACVAQTDLQRAISGNMRIAVDVLATGTAPRPADLSQPAIIATERFAVGVDIEEVIVAFRISFRDIHEAFMELAATTLPIPELICGARNLWDASDAFVGRAINVYNQLRLDNALAQADRRNRIMRTLLAGGKVTPEDLTALGLDPKRNYAVIRAPHRDRPKNTIPFIIELDNIDVGLSATLPIVSTDDLVAIGDFMPLEEITLSDTQAQRVLNVASSLGKTGLHSIATLGWRMAFLNAEEVTKHYHRTFLTPLLERGQYGADLLQTVTAWITHNRSYIRTAEDENLHVNSIRHRINRFSKLTGYTDDTDDFIGLVWALESMG